MKFKTWKFIRPIHWQIVSSNVPTQVPGWSCWIETMRLASHGSSPPLILKLPSAIPGRQTSSWATSTTTPSPKPPALFASLIALEQFMSVKFHRCRFEDVIQAVLALAAFVTSSTHKCQTQVALLKPSCHILFTLVVSTLRCSLEGRISATTDIDVNEPTCAQPKCNTMGV